MPLISLGRKEVKFFNWKMIEQMVYDHKNLSVKINEKVENEASEAFLFSFALSKVF